MVDILTFVVAVAAGGIIIFGIVVGIRVWKTLESLDHKEEEK